MDVDLYYCIFHSKIQCFHMRNVFLMRMSVFFIILCFFFKVNSGFFLHNRVATLVVMQLYS